MLNLIIQLKFIFDFRVRPVDVESVVYKIVRSVDDSFKRSIKIVQFFIFFIYDFMHDIAREITIKILLRSHVKR